MRYFVTIEGHTLEVDVDGDGIVVDGQAVTADLRPVPGTDVHHLLLDGRGRALIASPLAKGAWDLHLSGRRLRAEVVDERTRAIREMTGAAAAARGPQPLRAPMPGLVLRVDVEAGQKVVSGQGLVIVEAMKMENELRAAAAATVARVRVEPGQPVEKGTVLVEFATDGAGPGPGAPED